jgi:hypothetical protein
MTPPQYFWEHGMWVLPFVMMTIISLVMLAALPNIWQRRLARPERAWRRFAAPPGF